MNQHGKTYETPDEFQFRYQIWKNHMTMIAEHNDNEENTFTVAMNEFGDMSNNEFRAQYNKYVPNLQSNNNVVVLDTTDLPDSVDWRKKGAVTPVKNQGSCGSCWSFSTTGSVEGAHFLATGNLVSLSEQELVSCSKNGNKGCDGGEMDLAFEWIIKNGGICAESSFPYSGSDGTCKTCSSVATISSYHDVKSGSQAQLTAAAAQQPVSVAVDAGGFGWQFYFGGVMSSSCGDSLDHGVLVVGYGSDSGKDYYIVKNSWGASWGESGYIRLARNTASADGECGVAKDASYPIV